MENVCAVSPSMVVFVCLMIGFSGFVDSIAGGGGIISLPAYILTGLPMHLVLGTNLFSSACGMTVAVAQFWRYRAIDAKAALIAAVGSFAGAAVGAKIALMLSADTVKSMLVFILPVVAFIIMLKRNFGEENRSSELSKQAAIIFALLIGLLIGCYDGLFGPGSGTFSIMAFAMIMKYDLRTASGNTKILNLASNYAAVAVFALSGNILYWLAIPAAGCGVIGSYIGSKFAITKGAKFIRPMMLVVFSMMLARIIYDLIKM